MHGLQSVVQPISFGLGVLHFITLSKLSFSGLRLIFKSEIRAWALGVGLRWPSTPMTTAKISKHRIRTLRFIVFSFAFTDYGLLRSSRPIKSDTTLVPIEGQLFPECRFLNVYVAFAVNVSCTEERLATVGRQPLPFLFSKHRSELYSSWPQRRSRPH
jgi:hypothetical protein